MRLCVFSLTGLLFLVATLYSQEAPGGAPPSKGVRVGDLVPGPFYPFVTHGNPKDRIRCLINERAMEKVLVVFIQSNNVPDFLPKVLADLDAQLQKIPDPKKAIGSALVVFVNPEIKSVVLDDEKRDAFTKTLRTAIPEGQLQRVVIGVDDPNDLMAYQLPKDAGVVALIIENLKVMGLKTLKSDEMTVEKFAGVLVK